MLISFFVWVSGTAIASSLAFATDQGLEKLRLIDQIAQPWTEVKRFLIEYEAIPFEGTSGIPVHKIMASASPGSFYHMSAHFPGRQPWQFDPFSQEVFIRDGKGFHVWPFNRKYSEHPMKIGDPIPGPLGLDLLLLVMPKWLLTDYQVPTDPLSRAPLIPLDMMRSAECHLLPGSELIEGERCVIFDRDGLDRIWIAVEKGMCVLRREIRDPRSRRLVQRIVAERVAEFAPRLWLPSRFRSQIFEANVKNAEPEIERQSVVSIVRCEINEKVPESIFMPIFRPGTLKFGTDDQFVQVSPGARTSSLTSWISWSSMQTCRKNRILRVDMPHGLSVVVLHGLLVDWLRGCYWVLSQCACPPSVYPFGRALEEL
jgi:hypothetical protein